MKLIPAFLVGDFRKASTDLKQRTEFQRQLPFLILCISHVLISLRWLQVFTILHFQANFSQWKWYKRKTLWTCCKSEHFSNAQFWPWYSLTKISISFFSDSVAAKLSTHSTLRVCSQTCLLELYNRVHTGSKRETSIHDILIVHWYS
jgi:hypothetical protein